MADHADMSDRAVPLHDVAYHVEQVAALETRALEEHLRELQASEILRSDILFIVKIGIAHRSKSNFRLADQVFGFCLETPARFAALFELGVSKAHQGDASASIGFLETRLRESGMMPHERIFLALQYARIGQLANAHSELTDVANIQPDLARECLVSWQAYQFMNQFNIHYCRGLLQEIESRFPLYRSPEDVEERINHALASKQPFLLLRMGDGEGASLRSSIDDSAKFDLLYENNLEEFTEIWFGSRAVAGDMQFQRVLRDFNAAVCDVDLLGCLHPEGVEQEFRLGSRRGITWAVNVLRFITGRAGPATNGAQKLAVGSPNIHYALYASGCLERLIKSQKRIGLISCHRELAAILQDRLGLEVDFIKTPGEKIHGRLLGDQAVEGTHWPDRYPQIREEIARGDYAGQLFLVAAGMLGKVYGSDLKRRGAVVVDIGAVADAMVGRATRIFPSGVQRMI